MVSTHYSSYFAVDCFYRDQDYVGKDINKNCDDKTDTAKQCQELCQKTAGCLKFTYITDNYNGPWGIGSRKSCCLKGTLVTSLEQLEGVVSGPKECPGKTLHMLMIA